MLQQPRETNILSMWDLVSHDGPSPSRDPVSFFKFYFCFCLAPTPWVSLPGIEPVPPVVAARSLNHWSAGAVLQSPSFYDSTKHQALGVCCIQPGGGETMKDGSGRFFSTRVVSGKHNFYSHSIVFTHAKMSY